MRLGRLVVGVDFGDVSLSAARWVSAQFAPEAEIVLVHAVSDGALPSFAHGAAPADANDGEVLRSLMGGLAGVANLLGPDRVRAVVRRGAPADVLADVAHELRADLVCVGRSRQRTGSARFGATTNHRLLARTSIPTLIIPAGRQGLLGQVFVAVDDAPGAGHLVNAACELAAATEASVRAFHVLEDGALHAARMRDEDGMDDESDGGHGDAGGRQVVVRKGDGRWLRRRAFQWLDDMLERAARGSRRASVLIATGDAGQAIVRGARLARADLIVVGRGGAARSAVGSTTRFVTWAAPCPVLVLPSIGSTNDLPDRRGERRARDREVDVIALRNDGQAPVGDLPPAALFEHEVVDSVEGDAA